MAEATTIEGRNVAPAAEPAENVPATSDPMVSMIERVVLDPNVSIEKLERMLAMKERLEDRAREEQEREQKQAYYRAMAQCQSELKVVLHNQQNTHTKSTYADLAALAESADPIIHKHGFSTSFEPAGWNEKGEQIIKWEIGHDGGYVQSGEAAIPPDKTGSQGKVNKTDTQAFGSTATYGRRYVKLMKFDIATGDDRDGNRNDTDPVSQEQLDQLIAVADEVGADKKAFCEWLSKALNTEIGGLAEIPANAFDRAMRALEKKRGQASADS